MIANLQVLRGLAALAVVFYHTDYHFGADVHTEFQAVSVFFVISGFIMTYITRERADQFLAQRLIRIVPLYWLCTLAPLVAMLMKTHGRLWAEASAANIAKSLLFIPYRDMNGDLHPLLAVGWTLNLEIFFYLAFALMLAVSRRWAPLLTCLVLMAFKVVHEQFGCTAIVCEFYAHDYTVFLIAGVLVFYAWAAVRDRVAAVPRWIVVLVGTMAVVVFAFWNAYPPFAAFVQGASSVPIYYLMPPLVVTAVLTFHSARISCDWKIALAMGNASYALYLTHTLTLEALSEASGWWPIFDPRTGVLPLAAALILCSLVALAVYYRIEQPVLRHLRSMLTVKRSAAMAEQSAA